MANVVVSRKFRLHNLNLRDEFSEFTDIVNSQIIQGLQLPYTQFDDDTLVSVKKYYDQLNSIQSSLRERAHRCAAQSSYFIMRQYRSNQTNLLKIIDLKLSKGYFTDIRKDIGSSMKYYELENKLGFIKNKMIDNIDLDLNIFYNSASEKVKFDKIKLPMDKIVKSFKNKGIRRLNRRFKELQNGATNLSNYDTTFIDILKLSSIADIRYVTIKEWSAAKIRWKRSIDNINISHFKSNWGDFRDDRMITQNLFAKRNLSKYINGTTIKDFFRFLQLYHDEILIGQMVDYYRIHLLGDIQSYLQVMKLDLQKQIPTILKIPRYRSASIPVGIDDGQLYRLEEEMLSGKLQSVEIRVSLRSKEIQTVSISDIARYQSMLDAGFVAKRGVLSFSHGKYYVHIPFTKKVMKKRVNTRIAAVDFGLKTFGAISIFEDDKEVARQFLDQKNMGGKKSDWWLNPKPLSIKGKLMEHRYEVKKQQSTRMQSRKRSIPYWYARNIERSNWRRIRNSNMELVRQISARIGSYILYHDVSTLVLEDLKWSKHSLKSDVGYFLSSWQIHWFFAQIQNMLVNMSQIYGFTIEMVNPRYSSKNCWKCGEFGNRLNKVFICTSSSCVRYQIDSDLNAARNLVLRSKKYKLILDAIRRKGRTP